MSMEQLVNIAAKAFLNDIHAQTELDEEKSVRERARKEFRLD